MRESSKKMEILRYSKRPEIPRIKSFVGQKFTVDERVSGADPTIVYLKSSKVMNVSSLSPFTLFDGKEKLVLTEESVNDARYVPIEKGDLDYPGFALVDLRTGKRCEFILTPHLDWTYLSWWMRMKRYFNLL